MNIHRVQRPDGTFANLLVPGDTSTPEPTLNLHICSDCQCDMRDPPEWSEADAIHWHLTIRCPNCEKHTSGIYTQSECDLFDDQLLVATEAAQRQYKARVATNMEEELARFLVALDTNNILPEDF